MHWATKALMSSRSPFIMEAKRAINAGVTSIDFFSATV
jgi:hypothetical protein